MEHDRHVVFVVRCVEASDVYGAVAEAVCVVGCVEGWLAVVSDEAADAVDCCADIFYRFGNGEVAK